MTRPRLLVVGPTPPPVHGTAVYVRMLLESPELAAGWDVRHLDTSDRRSLENLGRFDPVNVALAVKHVADLGMAVRREAPDVVYVPVSQNAPAYLRDALFIGLASLGGARVVTHLHGGYFGEFHRRASGPVRLMLEESSRRVARAWVLGEGLRPQYEGLVPPARVRVVPNGVPGPAEAPERPGERPGGPVVLYLGQLSEAKGVGDLVEAFGRLPRRDPAPRLVLAGGWLSGGDEAAVRERVEASPARDRIELPGVVTGEAKARLLAGADVFALPSRYPYEGQPLAVLEAMAAALPVVATARGAIPDMVVDGETGLRVPEGDPDILAGALERLLHDPDLRRRLGRAGRERWEARFTRERCLGRVVAELDELVGRPGAETSPSPPPRGAAEAAT